MAWSHFRLVYESPGNYYMQTKLAYLDQYDPNYYQYVPFVDNYPSYSNYSEAFNWYNVSRGPIRLSCRTAWPSSSTTAGLR